MKAEEPQAATEKAATGAQMIEGRKSLRMTASDEDEDDEDYCLAPMTLGF